MKKIFIIFCIAVLASLVSCGDDDDDNNIIQYGNWCGPGYSGPDAAVDSLDSCCQGHDQCYDDHEIPLKDYAKCVQGDKVTCDVDFVDCMDALASDPSNWAVSPADEDDALEYKTSATALFTACEFISDLLDKRK